LISTGILSILCLVKHSNLNRELQSVKTIQKLVLCFGLLTVLSAPLAGCSGTWHGMKEDWHDVTSSNDSPSDTPTTTTADASAVPATPPAQVEPAASADTTTLRSETTTTTTYNR
jgi:hypothetical protein